MQRVDFPQKNQWPTLLQRPLFNNLALEKSVRKILDKVKKDGDKAIRKFTREFDGVKLKKFIVDKKEITQAIASLDQQLKDAIDLAYKNIYLFHSNQLTIEPELETMPGIRCWREAVPIDKVRLYIPGGSAPLFSTVLMLGIPAQIAGCKEVLLCTPPSKEGSIHPAVLYAAQLAGISKIFKVGGAQAIGGMAFGTETIPRVYKIFGPGNQYVNCAKQLVQQDQLSIDMPAGPSEVCVLADDTANVSFVAADLLSQAEHGADSQVLLVTTSARLIDELEEELELQLQQLPRAGIARKSLGNSHAILLDSLDTCMDIVNDYAPEHLIIATGNPELLAKNVRNAGSVFLGHFTPESAGDYATGTNHTLPTNAAARSYSGVSTESFMKKISFQHLSEQGLRNIGNAVELLARTEGLDAHANAVTIRLKNLS